MWRNGEAIDYVYCYGDTDLVDYGTDQTVWKRRFVHNSLLISDSYTSDLLSILCDKSPS